MARDITVTLNSPFTFENLIINNGHFDNTERTYLMNQYNNLQWANFSNAIVICNYYNDIDSSKSGQSNITSYTVQRRKNGQKYWDTILQGDVVGQGQTPNENQFAYGADNYSIIDYNVQNNTKYDYRVYPNITNKQAQVITQTEEYDDNGKLVPFITDWEIFTLTPLIITKDPKSVNKGVATPYMVDGKPLIWAFIANVEEGSLTKVQDKTYFDTFTRYPKVSVGQTAYFTIPFSALLGTIDQDLDYYEPNNVWEQWNDFINLNLPCLYKNVKGDCRIVSINPDTSNTYANTYANYYINDNDFVTTRPTTVSLNLTEILDATQYTITQIVPQQEGE